MARGFRFRLEAIRTMRRRARDAQQRVVAEAVMKVTKFEAHITDLTSELRRSIDISRDRRRQGQLDLHEIRSQQVHSGRLQRRVLESQETLAQCNKIVTEQRELLAHAAKELDVIERLRDKQWARHLSVLQAAEQAATDEAAREIYRRRAGVREVHVR